jgi:CRISPR-associated exonuclease Cas4
VDLPSLTASWVAIALVAIGLAVAAAGASALARRRRDRVHGALVSIDVGRSTELRSERYRLVGRPDAVRRGSDGRLVPVEVKSRTAPPRGPAYSHLVQVWAYCLLVEETTGVPPRYGVLRYADQEFRVPWDAEARSELLSLRRALARPYDGRARPSPARCGRCAWVSGCDARAPYA